MLRRHRDISQSCFDFFFFFTKIRRKIRKKKILLFGMFKEMEKEKEVDTWPHKPTICIFGIENFHTLTKYKN